MDTLAGGLTDGLYDLVPTAHHTTHADTTHAHARDGDGTLTGGTTHAHQQHNSASSAARLTVLSASRAHDPTSRGNHAPHPLFLIPVNLSFYFSIHLEALRPMVLSG